jgi:hypothetical protein
MTNEEFVEDFFDKMYAPPKTDYQETTSHGVTFRIGDAVRIAGEVETEGTLESLYIGGTGKIIAAVKMGTDPNGGPHADCPFCRSWAHPVDEIELV